MSLLCASVGCFGALRVLGGKLKRMHIAELPVIAVRIASATSWGNLSLEKSD